MSGTVAPQSDVVTRDLVEAELNWTSQISEPATIAVAVTDGIVTLTGTVPSFVEKIAAGSAALRTRGVHAVANDIDVTVVHLDDDTTIAGSAYRALSLNTVIPEGKVQAEVTNGVVILTGSVPWNFQREAAGSSVVGIPGVRGVRNDVTLIPRSSSIEAQEHIRQAFARLANLDANGIDVGVKGTTVTLRGEVSSDAERRAASDAAWQSPHVSTVVNDLRVAN